MSQIITKERGITMIGPNIQPILADLKTQTRRIVNPQPTDSDWAYARKALGGNTELAYPVVSELGGVGLRVDRRKATGFFENNIRCPYGRPGNRLYVKENGWQPKEPTLRELMEGADTWPEYVYDADGISEADVEQFKQWGWKRRSSTFMPRRFSRILLKITDVRIERLQDISDEDAKAEGVALPEHTCTMYDGIWRDGYRRLWESINGAGSWNLNPWVWAISFRRIG